MDQMVNDLILQPLARDIPKMGGRVRVIGKFLEEKGGMESSRYERFKEHVRQMAMIYLSSPRTVYKKQPSREWEVFSSKLTAEYPELVRFHNLWPLILYFNEWASGPLAVKARAEFMASSVSAVPPKKNLFAPPSTDARLATSDQNHPMSMSTHPVQTRGPNPARKQVSQYVGKPPPKGRRRSLHLVDASPIRERTTGSTSQTQPQRFVRAAETQRNLNQIEKVTTRAIYRDDCIQCGKPPIINEPDKCLLNDILLATDLSSVAPLLKSFGIHHDGHLYLLDLLNATERRDVLKGIPNIPAIDTYALIKHLENRIAGRDHFHTRDSSNAIGMLCDEHRASFKSKHPVSPVLESTLKMKGMEALVPIAALYGISNDRQLDRLLGFSQSDLEDFFNTYHSTRASLFYRRLLRIALKVPE
ncbi:hypothetical protein L218DRAFT_984752 [Marasmius fiardii PR-910]|nr:hypothetical protein L218DRAFT_984752 [Marasmius fiardii PR-910]